jgi:HEAT repeat protein
VAALSSAGLVISGNAIRPKVTLRTAMELVDIAALPDGRLLCSLGGHVGLGVVDVEKNEITRIYARPPFDAHSVAFAGARVAPTLPRVAVDDAKEKSRPTGFLLGQSVYLTRQRNVDISRVKAIRVIEGRSFATRSARHPYDHLGVEAIELGTVPLAPDGSFYIEAPADRALSIQAVDGEGRSVVNELSWIYVRPGEQRSCVGCHSQQDAAPSNLGQIMALRRAPVKLLGAGEPHRWRGNNAANGGVLNMQFERMREVGSINAHELRLEEWINRLNAREIEARISASQRLAALREKSAAAQLEKLLKDEAAKVRMNAALALATCGRRESVGALFASLVDEDSAVAQAGAIALQNVTGGAANFNGFAPLEERRKLAVEWKSALEIESLDSRLIGRLSCDSAKAEDTLNALGHVGTGAAVKAIEAFIAAGTNDLRSTVAAVRAIGQIGSVEAVAGLEKILREQSAIKMTGPGDHEFGWTQAPVQIAAAAAEALGRIGSAKSEAALLSAFASLRDFWEFSFRTADHDWLMGCHASPVHYRILEALDRIGSERAAGIVPQILRSIPIDPDRAVLFEIDAYETVAANVIARSGLRENVVRSCAAVLLGESIAADFISAVTNSPPAVSVGPMPPVARAAQILSTTCGPGDAALLRDTLAKYRARDVSAERNWTCFYLARGLGKIRDQGATELLASILKDDPEASLGLLSPPNVFVFEAMTPMYRAAVADALGRIGSSASFATLLEAASSHLNALDVRNASAAALIRIATVETSPQIRSVGVACPEMSTRKLLFEACEAALQHKPSTAQ